MVANRCSRCLSKLFPFWTSCSYNLCLSAARTVNLLLSNYINAYCVVMMSAISISEVSTGSTSCDIFTCGRMSSEMEAYMHMSFLQRQGIPLTQAALNMNAQPPSTKHIVRLFVYISNMS